MSGLDRALRRPKVALAVLLGLVSLLGVIVYVEWVAPGPALGSPCTDAGECDGWPDNCLHDGSARYCSTRCDGVADCPSGWTCGLADDDEDFAKRVPVDPGGLSNVTGFCVR